MAVAALGLPVVLEQTLAWPTPRRILLAFFLLGIPAFFMGMPFPSALARLAGGRPASQPGTVFTGTDHLATALEKSPRDN